MNKFRAAIQKNTVDKTEPCNKKIKVGNSGAFPGICRMMNHVELVFLPPRPAQESSLGMWQKGDCLHGCWL